MYSIYKFLNNDVNTIIFQDNLIFQKCTAWIEIVLSAILYMNMTYIYYVLHVLVNHYHGELFYVQSPSGRESKRQYQNYSQKEF